MPSVWYSERSILFFFTNGFIKKLESGESKKSPQAFERAGAHSAFKKRRPAALLYKKFSPSIYFLITIKTNAKSAASKAPIAIIIRTPRVVGFFI